MTWSLLFQLVPALALLGQVGCSDGHVVTGAEGSQAGGGSSSSAGGTQQAPATLSGSPSSAAGAAAMGGASATNQPRLGGMGSAGGGGGALSRSLAKFEPGDGKTLLLVGQDTGEVEQYAQAFGFPAGVMLYSNVWDGLGVLAASGFGGLGTSDAQHWSTKAEPFALQIGLDLDSRLGCNDCASCSRGGHLEALAAGAGPESSVVAALAERFKESARPVFLRVGYEFDAEICPGGFGKYPTAAYRRAFERVVDIMHERGADNVAFVWNAWAFQARDPASRAAMTPWAWYPGDELVDWIALSVFPGTSAADPNELQQVDKRRQLAQFAASHGKPLMVGESSPRARFAPAHGDSAWSGWYEGLLAYIAENDVKALSYINMDWEALPAWAGQGWGNTRLQGSPLAGRWTEQLNGARFIRSSATLYQQMGFR